MFLQPGDRVRILPLEVLGTVVKVRQDVQGEALVDVRRPGGEMHVCRLMELKKSGWMVCNEETGISHRLYATQAIAERIAQEMTRYHNKKYTVKEV